MTCACGCNDRSPGFDQIAPGVYKGRGAGYSLVRCGGRWDVLDPAGALVRDSIPHTLDEANAAAVAHARAAGHGHA